MDVNDFRNLVTLLSFVLFVGIVRWAMSGKNKARFDEAQLLPFVGEESAPTTNTSSTETLK
jgi:cytochrome c oxidase cbb3-type subunit IV